MMYLNNMSSERIAEVSSVSSNAVRSRFKQIKQSVEQKYAEEF